VPSIGVISITLALRVGQCRCSQALAARVETGRTTKKEKPAITRKIRIMRCWRPKKPDRSSEKL